MPIKKSKGHSDAASGQGAKRSRPGTQSPEQRDDTDDASLPPSQSPHSDFVEEDASSVHSPLTDVIIAKQEAIQLAEQAVQALPDGHLENPQLLNDISVHFSKEFEKSNAFSHLEASIIVAKLAVDAAVGDRSQRAACLNTLASGLHERYEQTVDLEDLQEAIEIARQIIGTTQPGDENGALYLNNLGIRLGERFLQSEETNDIEESIHFLRQAVDTTPNEDSEKGRRLNNLATSLGERFKHSRTTADLDESISLTRRAINALDATNDGWSRATYLNNLGVGLYEKFMHTGVLTYLDGAIQAVRDAVDATPDDNPDRVSYLNTLGERLREKYEQTGVPEYLREAIEITWKALYAHTCHLTDEQGVISNTLGNSLGSRFQRTMAVEDADEAAQLLKSAVEITPDGHPHQAGYLADLGELLGRKYAQTWVLDDLEEAVQVSRQAVSSAQGDDTVRALCLQSLAVRLGQRFSRLGDISDLEEGIEAVREALAMIPDELNRKRCLNTLGGLCSDRYIETQTIDNLDEAIQVARDATIISPNSGDQGYCLNTLANCLNLQYRRLGAMADLDEVIQITRASVDSIPNDHPDRAARLHNLGVSLHDRYVRVGDMEDLDEGIQAIGQANQAVPDGHADRARWLDTLGSLFSARYEGKGTISDLEEAILASRGAADAVPDNHIFHTTVLGHLGIHLHQRYEQFGAQEDLEEAIRVTTRAIERTPSNSTDLTGRLASLGILLRDRYKRMGSRGDLDEAIRATPKDHPHLTERWNDLAMLLAEKYSATEVTADVEQGILLAKQAVDMASHDDPQRPLFLSTLASLLHEKFTRTKAIEDLDLAIRIAQQAVQTASDDYENQAENFSNIGVLLGDRYIETGAITDLEESRRFCTLALYQSNSPTFVRIQAGRELVQSCRITFDWERAFEASRAMLKLIPKLTPRSIENSDKQHALSQIVGMASDGAAVALQAGRGPLVALRLLEQGRGVLAGSLEEVRTDLSDLEKQYPELAKQFVLFRDQLELPIARKNPLREHDYGPSSRPTTGRAHRRYDAGKGLDALISDIRMRPGFESFLTAPSEEDMRRAASSGTIATVNVSEIHCDVILIQHHRIWSLELPLLESKTIQQWAQASDLGSPEVLEWLWKAVTRPILDALGYTQLPPNDEWPHVWWIATGPLSRFPLHAAGLHHSGKANPVLDRVMSSYSSSVKTIMYGRKRYAKPVDDSKPAKALVLAMRETPGYSNLVFAAREVAELCSLCDHMVLEPVQPGRHKKDVMKHLPSSKLFHFAGHGYTDAGDPSKSCLLLEDWETDRFTIETLMEMNLHANPPFLAYLSACGTGQVTVGRFIDESIHLTSACQLAGFRHVIGTLWKVNDEVCVNMSKLTYREMLKGGMTDESVCLGLHKATRELRQQWLDAGRGSQTKDGLPRDVEVVEDDQKQSLLWVPYVHYGV
ncbi:CHAT domain-containing protein [Ilyonectria destructans]|nr:CHAT domain-containing protein [Ilyonectria destructans]